MRKPWPTRDCRATKKWLRKFVASPSLWSPAFNIKPIDVVSVEEKEAMGHDVLGTFGFPL
jgi:hypothetical protein